MTGEDLTADALGLLEKLVAFDTTSRRSNLALIDFVAAYLSGFGIASSRVPNAAGDKCNLLATVGAPAADGVVLSGHTDVVPVDDQDWSSDPFVLTRRGGRLFGRGTCDMKAFLALCLAAVPLFDPGKRPVHLAFSYDEEVGCLGAPDLIDHIVQTLPPPMCAIVGEPTEMRPMNRHKGISAFRVTVIGQEAHSSLTHLGLSANMIAIRLLGELADLAERLARDADPASPFSPPGATLSVGQINGGTAINILAGRCTFLFDLRAPAPLDPDILLRDFFALASELDSRIRSAWPASGIQIERLANAPALDVEPDGAAEQMVRRLSGDNRRSDVASYAAEGGQFQRAGISTILCGPGSIEQAHKADEYIEIEQVERCASFLLELAQELRA